MFTGYVTGESY